VRVTGFALAQLVALGLALGCATPPKPPELDAFERLRNDPAAAAAAKRAPDLVNNADRWLARSRDEWQSNDLDEAVHSALMGQIKLKEAMARAEQERAKAVAAATVEIERSRDEQARLSKELTAMNEQLALLGKLQAQAAELSAEKQQLDTTRQKATASEKMADAELALKTADTMNAAKWALPQLQAGKDLLSRAQQELQQGSFAAAQLSADMAKKKADEAAELSKPHYQQEAKSAESRAQADDLAREASAISPITVRRDSRGALQRIVLQVPADELFVRRQTTITPAKGGSVLDQISGLIKKYSTFPVQVTGYTDTRGRSGELLALSLARAQSVHTALIARGVEPARMGTAIGQGGAEPVGDNRTISGRAQNNRVEIVFVYQ
jgi:outer membrane protein OmpA-like peptidoglycan-associated protein